MRLLRMSDLAPDCVDWAKLEQKLEELLWLIEPVQVLSSEDYRRFCLSHLTFGLIESDFMRGIDYGVCISPAGEDVDRRRSSFVRVLGDLGFSRSYPEGEYYSSEQDLVRLIRHCIESRQITTDFLLSWGRLNYLVGESNILFAQEPYFGKNLPSILGGLYESVVIQRHWYAYWINRHAPSLKPRDRHVAENALQDLCVNIVEGILEPAFPYPRDWFRRMLRSPIARSGRARSSEYALTDRITRTSIKELERMLRDPLITPEVLPPLSSDLFKVVKSPPPGDGA
jgi:hypothetical protein